MYPGKQCLDKGKGDEAKEMTYIEFYNIAEYGSKNWKGNFSPREIACNANSLWEDFLWSKSERIVSRTIVSLVKNLKEDDTEQTKEWISQIKEELKEYMWMW